MSNSGRIAALFAVLSLLSMPALAGEDAAIRAALSKVLPDVKIDSINPTPIKGLFEVMSGTQLMYITGDGKYFIDGRIVDLDRRVDITEPRLAAARLKEVNGIGENNMIIFAPEKYNHTITVFTDIECGYCRKLHRQIKDYENEGIRVRYVFFPRAGKPSRAYDEAVSVWCSNDRQAALTAAKAGQAIEPKTCPNPVDEHMAVGRDLGINGTPAILLDDGKLIPGYVEPKRLAALLNGTKVN